MERHDVWTGPLGRAFVLHGRKKNPLYSSIERQNREAMARDRNQVARNSCNVSTGVSRARSFEEQMVNVVWKVSALCLIEPLSMLIEPPSVLIEPPFRDNVHAYRRLGRTNAVIGSTIQGPQRRLPEQTRRLQCPASSCAPPSCALPSCASLSAPASAKDHGVPGAFFPMRMMDMFV